MKYLLLLLLFITSCTVYKQSIPGKYEAQIYCDSDDYTTYTDLPDTINVRTQIIYFTDKEYVTPINVDNINDKLSNAKISLNVESHKIVRDKAIINTFKYLGSDESISDYFYLIDKDYNDKDFFNIYIVPKSKSPVIGRAKDIPSNAVLMREFNGGFDNILIHEIGHSFGLFHTHENDSAEYNTNHTGDRVCDTPICRAPIRELSDTTMTIEQYNTLLHNYMSYPPRAIYMSNFTNVQIQRIRFMFENVPLLRKLIDYD